MGTIQEFINGKEFCSYAEFKKKSEDQQAKCIEQLAKAFATLHNVPLEKDAEILPVPWNRWNDIGGAIERQEEIPEASKIRLRAMHKYLLENPTTTGFGGSLGTIHADPHCGNIFEIFDENIEAEDVKADAKEIPSERETMEGEQNEAK